VIGLVLLPAMAATLGATLLRLALGPPAWGVPSLALAFVLLAARRDHPVRYVVVAVGTGVVAGVALPHGLLVPPLVLVLLGALAHRTRRWFPVEGPRGRLVYGSALAAAELVLLLVFPGPGPGLTLVAGGWPWAVGGLVLTGALYAGLEELAHAWDRLDYVLTRP